MTAIPFWVPIALSLISICASAAFGYFTLKDRRQNLRISREREIYAWATETLGLVPNLRASDDEKRTLARSRLSVQIDIGRLLFPNDRDNDFGQAKHPLNQGFRSKVLDPLIAMYDATSSAEIENERNFEMRQKDFIYEVSQHFPPVKTNTSPEFLTQWHKTSRKEPK